MIHAVDSDRVANGRPAAPDETAVQERLLHLAQVPLFQSVDLDELVPLAAASEWVLFQPGEVIVRQGEPGESVYVVLRGRVEVRVQAGGGNDSPGAPAAAPAAASLPTTAS